MDYSTLELGPPSLSSHLSTTFWFFIFRKAREMVVPVIHPATRLTSHTQFIRRAATARDPGHNMSSLTMESTTSPMTVTLQLLWKALPYRPPQNPNVDRRDLQALPTLLQR